MQWSRGNESLRVETQRVSGQDRSTVSLMLAMKPKHASLKEREDRDGIVGCINPTNYLPAAYKLLNRYLRQTINGEVA